MKEKLPIKVPQPALDDFCQRNHIHLLAFFGSVLREDFGPDSDVDIIVQFEPRYVPGLISLAGLELELSEMFGGRKVDLNTPGFFKPSLRKRIMAEAVVQYGQG